MDPVLSLGFNFLIGKMSEFDYTISELPISFFFKPQSRKQTCPDKGKNNKKTNDYVSILLYIASKGALSLKIIKIL